MSHCNVHSGQLLDDQIGFDTCDCHLNGKPVTVKENVKKTKIKINKKGLKYASDINKICIFLERLAFLVTFFIIVVWFSIWLAVGSLKIQKYNDIICRDVKVIPLDIITGNETLFSMYLCNKTNAGKYEVILLVNHQIFKVLKTWIKPERLRMFATYCIESQAYCKRMMNIPVETNHTFEDCYYKYTYIDISLCLNANEELMFGLVSDKYKLTVRELNTFVQIIYYWF
jgi:hypothetical protein